MSVTADVSHSTGRSNEGALMNILFMLVTADVFHASVWLKVTAL